MKKELMVLIALASVWCAGIVAAPVLHDTASGEVLYRMYGGICHQFESRSFSIHGEPFAVCMRCTSIYAAFLTLLMILLAVPVLRSRQWHSVRLIVMTGLPMFIDGAASLTGFWESTVASRVMTGAMFGAGMALLLHDVLCVVLRTTIFQQRTTYGTKT